MTRYQIPRPAMAGLGTSFGANAVKRLFTDAEIEELMILIRRLAA